MSAPDSKIDLQRVASAIESAIHDRELESLGVTIDWYVDTDVVVDYVTALPRALPGNTDFLSKGRAAADRDDARLVAQVLLGFGHMPKSTLLWPHLFELDGFITAHSEALSRVEGIAPLAERIIELLKSDVSKETLRAFDAAIRTHDRKKISTELIKLTEALDLRSLATLEALHWPSWVSRLNHIVKFTQYGPSAEADRQTLLSRRDQLVRVANLILDVATDPVDRARTAGSDAAALLCLQDLVKACWPSQKRRVRFLTHTRALAQVANDPSSGLRLVDDPSVEVPIGGVDVPQGTLRSQLYFILRSVFPALRWCGAQTTVPTRPGVQDHSHDLGAIGNKNIVTLGTFKTYVNQIREGIGKEAPASLSGDSLYKIASLIESREIIKLLKESLWPAFISATWVDRSTYIAPVVANAISATDTEVRESLEENQSRLAAIQDVRSSSVMKKLREELSSATIVIDELPRLYSAVKDVKWRGGVNRKLPQDVDAGLIRWLPREAAAYDIASQCISDLLSDRMKDIDKQVLIRKICREVYVAPVALSLGNQSPESSDPLVGGAPSLVTGYIHGLLSLGLFNSLPNHVRYPHLDKHAFLSLVECHRIAAMLEPKASIDETAVIKQIDDADRIMAKMRSAKVQPEWVIGQGEFLHGAANAMMYMLVDKQQSAPLPRSFDFADECSRVAYDTIHMQSSQYLSSRVTRLWVVARIVHVGFATAIFRSDELKMLLDECMSVADETSLKSRFTVTPMMYGAHVLRMVGRQFDDAQQLNVAMQARRRLSAVVPDCHPSVIDSVHLKVERMCADDAGVAMF